MLFLKCCFSIGLTIQIELSKSAFKVLRTNPCLSPSNQALCILTKEFCCLCAQKIWFPRTNTIIPIRRRRRQINRVKIAIYFAICVHDKPRQISPASSRPVVVFPHFYLFYFFLPIFPVCVFFCVVETPRSIVFFFFV